MGRGTGRRIGMGSVRGWARLIGSMLRGEWLGKRVRGECSELSWIELIG